MDIKKARAHWATVRKFVQKRSHALFWYAYTGKQLCAPGGKWAERDRVDAGPVHDGVCTSKLEDNFAYFNAIDVYRPIAITQSDLVKMRNTFLLLYGSPYEPVVNKFANRCRAVAGCHAVNTRRAYKQLLGPHVRFVSNHWPCQRRCILL